ncbi:MAG: hypothetical protein DHS20C02_05010 [Micavibrio sp.]|nr:MAG: hypothetical protein DHS20C02_05010 [Micavibrio sp.]
MKNTIDNLKILLFFAGFTVLIAFFSISKYEATVKTNEFVTAEVLEHYVPSGEFDADPGFHVKLPSGREVNVRDWGEIPSSYRGKVVLEKQRGQTTGRVVYKINIEETKEFLPSLRGTK